MKNEAIKQMLLSAFIEAKAIFPAFYAVVILNKNG